MKRIAVGLAALLVLVVLLASAPLALAAEGETSTAAPAGRWEANAFLLLLYVQNQSMFEAFLASGAHVFNCVARDERGHVLPEPGVCVDPEPTFPF
jgi:hypothetical protein